MPSLTVNKIGLERVEEGKENNNNKKQRRDGSEIDLQLLKGMCFWIRRKMTDSRKRKSLYIVYCGVSCNKSLSSKPGQPGLCFEAQTQAILS